MHVLLPLVSTTAMNTVVDSVYSEHSFNAAECSRSCGCLSVRSEGFFLLPDLQSRYLHLLIFFVMTSEIRILVYLNVLFNMFLYAHIQDEFVAVN
jgi:hypothetical protein